LKKNAFLTLLFLKIPEILSYFNFKLKFLREVNPAANITNLLFISIWLRLPQRSKTKSAKRSFVSKIVLRALRFASLCQSKPNSDDQQIVRFSCVSELTN